MCLLVPLSVYKFVVVASMLKYKCTRIHSRLLQSITSAKWKRFTFLILPSVTENKCQVASSIVCRKLLLQRH